MNAKENFKKFSDKYDELLPFCLKFNWWNEVVKESWDVAYLNNGSEVFAIWPYFIRQKGPWRLICNPHFTPYCGPFLIYPADQKEERRIAFENKSYKQLIEQLPDFAELDQNFHLQFHNSLAYHWAQFDDYRRFTYLIDLSNSEEDLWNLLRENTRRQIRKAEKTLVIDKQGNTNDLIQHILDSFAVKNDAFPIDDLSAFDNVFTYFNRYNAGEVWTAKDESGNQHASIAIVNDHLNAYYLMGGSGREFKNSGAMSLLLWHAVLESKNRNKLYFNTEGSMDSRIEQFLRGFGGRLTPYSRLYKNTSKSFSIVRKLKP